MSQLSFSETGISIPTTSEIRSDIVSKMQAAFQGANPNGVVLNCDPAQPMGQVVDALVAEIEAKNSEIAFLASAFGMPEATGAFLDALVSLYFIERKVSEPTIVQCTCTGLQGTVIPFGAVVQDTNGNQYRCLSLVDTTIGSSGTVSVNFAAVEHGPLEVEPGTVTKIVTTVPGWDSVTNPAAGVTGRVRESDAELRARAQASVAANSHGSVDAIRSAVAAVDGVLDVGVLENFGSEPEEQFGITIPGHSIAVCVAGGEGADIAQAIYQKKDAGCGMTGTTDVTYSDPNYQGASYTYPIIVPENTNLYVQITFFGTSMSEAAQEQIVNAIVADAAGEGNNPRIGLAQVLYASRFWSVILGQTSVPIKSIGMALGSASGFTDNITINADVEPVVSSATVSIVFEGS